MTLVGGPERLGDSQAVGARPHDGQEVVFCQPALSGNRIDFWAASAAVLLSLSEHFPA